MYVWYGCGRVMPSHLYFSKITLVTVCFVVSPVEDDEVLN